LFEYIKFMDKKFQIKGNGPDEYNCWNFCVALSKANGLFLPPEQPVIDLKERDGVISQIKEDFVRIDEPGGGLVVTFRIHPKYVTHMGMLLDERRFIHIVPRKHVCVENLNSLQWRDKIDGYWKYRS